MPLLPHTRVANAAPFVHLRPYWSVPDNVDKGVGKPVAYALKGEVESEPNLKTMVKADTLYLLTGSKKRS